MSLFLLQNSRIKAGISAESLYNVFRSGYYSLAYAKSFEDFLANDVFRSGYYSLAYAKSFEDFLANVPSRLYSRE
jgi:hypothetical protein